jgi:pyrimidine 5'-nucleotidase
MNSSALFFDLDDTLYPNSNGLWEAIRARMTDYLGDPLGFPADEIPELRQTYFETYGTTLRGLQINHSVDADDYLAFVHDLPLEEYISPDPQLHDLLISLPQRKWIFTNADSNHAMRVLGILGLEDCFDGIIDVRALDYLCKPELQAYQRALALADETDPANCVLFDDSLRNLAPAQAAGFTTVLVGTIETHPGADYSVKKLNDLPQVFPQLWWIKSHPG